MVPDEVEDDQANIESKKVDVKYGSIRSIFMHADRVDMCLMTLGFIGAVFDGITDRLRLVFSSLMINTIGNSLKLDPKVFRHNLDKTAVGMLYLSFMSFVACFLEGYCWTRTSERQAARKRSEYLKAVLRQDLAYFDLQHATSSTSEVITSISNDTIIIQEAISEKIPNFVSNVSCFIGGYMVAFVLVWQLAMAAVPLALLLVVPGWLCGRSLMDLADKMRREYNKAGSIAEKAISSIRTVYAFGGERKTIEEFCESLKESLRVGLRQGLVKGLAIGSSGGVFAIWAILSYYGSRLVMYHGVRGGNIFAAGVSIVQGGLAFGVALSNMKDIGDACCAGERIMEMIERIPKIDSEDKNGISLEDIYGEVEFKQVTFSYPSRPESVVLRNFDLMIPAKRTIALVGTSGSGKSTVLSLLQRFYNPLEGEILLDGISIDKLQLKWLRSQMALVSQEPSLFSTTIKENILFGKDDANMEDILEASEAADAHRFISQLPQGYDTQVGERGIQLSGGQKQRIAIARAIIRKPRILLLDEATSALDSESEKAVQDAIERVAKGRTTVIIAHRLSTIKNVDVIAVVESGQLKEIGSHNELLQKESGVYKSFVCLQQIEKDKNPKEDECSSSFASIEDSENNTIDYLLDLRTSSPTTIPKSSSLIVSTGDALDSSKRSASSFWRLLGWSRPEWKQAILGCLSAICFGAVEPSCAVIMGTTTSIYFLTDFKKVKEEIRTSALCFLGFSLFSLLISVSQHYNFAYLGVYLSKRIREKMLSKILTFEVGWFDKDENSTSLICSRLAKDVNMVKSLVGDSLSLLVQAISAMTIAWTVGLIIAWRLAIVIIVAQPLIITCFYVKLVLLKSMSRKAIKAQDESTKLAAEAVSNLRVVTAFSLQDRILKMLEKAQEGPLKDNVRRSWITGVALGFALSIRTSNWCLNYWYGGKLVSEGYIGPSAVFQTTNVLLNTSYVIAEAGSLTTVLSKGLDTILSIFALLDTNTKIEPENLEGYQPEKITGHIELHSVQFSYPARPNTMILQDFSMIFEAGKSTALVGKSGSGKSTIICLIERFYDPLKGIVKIDGRDIRSYHLRSLRKHIALVNQEPTLFSGTMRENIIYGSSNNISESEIMDAARAANVHDFIMSQNDGYETWCGDKGLQLSGGQKQRIAIARAILRNPTILLLDEATSALDSHSEKVVHEALERMMMGITSVVVAHRLSTIRNCHQIAVMDKGKVVETGTHLTLMAKGGPPGAYYSLVNLQTMDH